MASIMDTLFGVSAERFQQERDAAADAQALQYARLSPIEKASFGVQRGAYGLAGALGGALGGTDPELQRRTQAQQILGMINPSNPETFFTAAQIAADRGDQQLAFGLRLEGDKYKQQKLVRDDEAAKRLREQTALRQQTEAQTLAQTAYQPGTPERAQMLDVQEREQMADQGTPMPENIAAVAPSFDIRRVAPQLQRLGAAGIAQLTAGLAAEKAMRPETISVKEGEVLYNYPTSPGGEYKPVITGGAKPTPFTGNMANAALSLFQTADPSKIFARAGQKGIDAVNAKALETVIAQRPVTNINTYVPASVEAQKQYIQDIAKERTVLRTAPDTIKNIEAAKKLIPTASTFMGKGGEPLLAAASFLNNRLGFSISTQGVTDATVLRTRLFEGILDNLKKLDSQPSQEQQRVLSEALGNLGTDPAALEQILNRISETVTDRVDRYNTDVNESEARGIKFPFKPQITLPQRKRPAGSVASQIPTNAPSAPTASQKPIYATNPTTNERIMSIDGGINWTSAR